MDMQSSTSDPGRHGAARQTWRKGNPRSLLQTIINKHPGADEREIHQLFWQEIEDDKELLRACVEYWLDNNYRSLTLAMSNIAPAADVKRRKQRQHATDVAVKTVQERIKFEARRVLLDWLMPNNKKLADCTGAECRQFGGWLGLLGKKIRPNSTVGQTFTEEQLQKLWKK